MKIFVSIVSYRDRLLHYTIKSLLDNKSATNDVVVGVLEQTAIESSLLTLAPDLVAHPAVRYQRIDPEYSLGIGWARHVNDLQLTDEDFYYQIDSHMLFDKDWDLFLLNDWKQGQSLHNTDRIIITGSCMNFDVDSFGRPVKHIEGIPRSCSVKYFHYQTHNNICGPHGRYILATDQIHPAIHICAGNMFTHAQWVKNVGNVSGIHMDGEEQLLVLRSFEAGYHLYHPTVLKCYHYISTRDYDTKIFKDPVISKQRIYEIDRRSEDLFNEYLQNFSKTMLERYREYSGVDYINRCLEDRAKTEGVLTAEAKESHQTPP